MSGDKPKCGHVIWKGYHARGNCKIPVVAEEGGKWWCGMHLPSAVRKRQQDKARCREVLARLMQKRVDKEASAVRLADELLAQINAKAVDVKRWPVALLDCLSEYSLAQNMMGILTDEEYKLVLEHNTKRRRRR